jgi:hypothetical protein
MVHGKVHVEAPEVAAECDAAKEALKGQASLRAVVYKTKSRFKSKQVQIGGTIGAKFQQQLLQKVKVARTCTSVTVEKEVC